MVAAVLGTLLLGGAQAEAVVFCSATDSRPNTTVVGLAGESAVVWGIKDIPTPLPWPAEGVVTGWRVPLGSAKGGLEQRLQVFRPLGPTTVLTIAESAAKVVSARTSGFFRTRIPIERGDLFGLRGTVETYTCGWTVGVTSGLYEGPTQVGYTYEFRPKADFGSPLQIAVETDVDGDGYGDESQDRCPRVATTQDACPTVNLRAKATAGPRSILLGVTVRTKARVVAWADVTFRYRGGWPTFSFGNMKIVRPDRDSRLRIELPEEVFEHLDRLASWRSLKAKVTVIATSVAGRRVERDLIVQLQGRART